MKVNAIYFVFCLLLLLVACGKRGNKVEQQEKKTTGLEEKDGMIYGLACEGCNDTFVVMIPTSDLDGRPLKLNVLRAMKRQKVIGILEPGDWCAVKLNAKDKSVADMVRNMDLLKGKWVHLVMPHEKDNARTPLLLENPDANVDSIIESYMIPIERGFQLMRKGRASTLGVKIVHNAESDKIPVEYSASSVYESWKVVDGQIILSEADSVKDPLDPTKMLFNKDCERDTCDLVLLLKDSLQISYKGHVSSYNS